MNANDYFDLARKLAQMRTEAGIRSAISRGYYAAFHFAKNLFEELGFPSDYDFVQTNMQTYQDCQFDLMQVAGIITFCDNHSIEPLRSELKTGVSDYVRKVGL
jgi:hypothetical protein